MEADNELLRRYAENDDQEAFRELVGRYVDLTYSVAVRVLGGNGLLAPDVVQRVFTDLARKAHGLSRHESLAGWLHTSVRLGALDLLRRERRLKTRQQESIAMHEANDPTTGDWEQLRPLLDEAIGRLRGRDREAILLRFFQGKSHREVAGVLGVGEDAARKCVDRALERLRTDFSRRGVAISSTLIVAAIDTHSIQAAPASLVPSIAAAIHAGGSSLVVATAVGSLKFMGINKITAAVAGVVGLAIVGFGVHENYRAREAETELSRAKQETYDLRARFASLEERLAAQSYRDRPAAIAVPSPKPDRSPTAAAQGATPVQSDSVAILAAAKGKLENVGNLGHSRNLQGVGIDEGAVATVRAWLERDPNDALQWLASLSANENQQMHTIEAMIAIEVDSDPELAFALANGISLQSSRLSRIADVVRIWAPLDPAAATRAVESADISPKEKTVLVAKIAVLQSGSHQ